MCRAPPSFPATIPSSRPPAILGMPPRIMAASGRRDNPKARRHQRSDVGESSGLNRFAGAIPIVIPLQLSRENSSPRRRRAATLAEAIKCLPSRTISTPAEIAYGAGIVVIPTTSGPCQNERLSRLAALIRSVDHPGVYCASGMLFALMPHIVVGDAGVLLSFQLPLRAAGRVHRYGDPHAVRKGARDSPRPLCARLRSDGTGRVDLADGACTYGPSRQSCTGAPSGPMVPACRFSPCGQRSPVSPFACLSYSLQRMAAWSPMSGAACRAPSSSVTATSSPMRSVILNLPPSPGITAASESADSAEAP